MGDIMADEHAALEAIRSRRSIRKYTDEPVSDEALRTILEAGRWAPSGLNNQPWRFLVLRAGDPRREALAGCTKYGHIVRGAAALICVMLEREAIYHEAKDHQSVGACVQNMLLAIHALGLGGVWLGEIINQQDQVFEVLGMPGDTHLLEAVIALGHPAARGSSSRRELSDLLLEAL